MHEVKHGRMLGCEWFELGLCDATFMRKGAVKRFVKERIFSLFLKVFLLAAVLTS